MPEAPPLEPGSVWAERNLTAAFHRTVLARYKCSLDLYMLEEDDCGGRLRRTDADDPDLPADEPQYFELRYGFRHLADGRICVVALLPDIQRLPTREQEAWAIELLGDMPFAAEDPTYQRWRGRMLEGVWNEAGPLEELKHQLHRIRATTSVGLGTPLFEASDSMLLHYPIGENSAELLASVAELHRLVVDGLRRQQLRELAAAMKVATEENEGTLSILKKTLPKQLVSRVHAPLAELRAARNKLHRVPAPQPHSMPAFDEFLRIARSVAAATGELRVFLVEALGVVEEDCVRRLEIMESPMRPSIISLGFPHAGAGNLEQIRQKTVDRVEIGAAGVNFGYGRDAVALHFTDGSSLFITPWCNVGNWEDKVQGFCKAELSIPLDLDFVPSGRGADPKIEVSEGSTGNMAGTGSGAEPS